MAVVDGWVRLGFTAGNDGGCRDRTTRVRLKQRRWVQVLSNKLRGMNKADLAVTATAFGLAFLLQPFEQFISGQRKVEQLGLASNGGEIAWG